MYNFEDTDSQLQTIPFDLKAGQAYLFLASRSTLHKLFNPIIANLALAGHLQVIDAGNQFDFYAIARMIRKSTPHFEETLAQIHIARAFTCYQVVTMLVQMHSVGFPLLITNMLTTFYDESVHLSERQMLLRQCLNELNRFKAQVPVVISASPHKDDPNDKFITLLENACDQITRFETLPPQSSQLSLF